MGEARGARESPAATGREPSGPPPRGPERAAAAVPVSRRATQVSVGFVVFALLALLAVPLLVQRRIAEIRQRTLDVATAARDLTDDVERALAVEVAAARAYALTGELEYWQKFQAARLDNARALGRLRPLTDRLGHGVRESADSLGVLLSAWEREPRTLLADNLPPAERRARLARQELLFQRTIRAEASLDTALGRATEAGRAEAAEAQQLGATLTVVLTVVALGALLLLVRLSQQLRQLAQREASLRRDLQASFRSRERLIRGFSHDLKNPLGAADGYAQLLESGYVTDPAKQQESIVRIRGALASALRLIEDILDLARAEAGQLRLTRSPVEVRDIARELIAEYEPQAHAAGLTVEAELPEDLPCADSDPARVRQILSNLLSNAIKYTPEGGRIGVRARELRGTRRSDAPDGWVVLDVWDTGPGIAPEERERVFEEFTRLQPQARPGAGVGLAISFRLARALGGDLTLESTSGAGSVFSLWLPAAPPGSSTSSTPTAA